jgi:hypothetical protein
VAAVGVVVWGFTVGGSGLPAFLFSFATFFAFAFGVFTSTFALAVGFAVEGAVAVVNQVGDPSLFSVGGAPGFLFTVTTHAGVFRRVVVGLILSADEADILFGAPFA